MERPRWIDEALTRGRGGAAAVRKLAAKLVDRARALARRVAERQAIAIACAVAAVLVVVWILWAIRAGSDNGGSAALGVLITWPLLLLIAANLALLVLGFTKLLRWMQPTSAPPGEDGAAATPPADPEATATDDGPAAAEAAGAEQAEASP